MEQEIKELRTETKVHKPEKIEVEVKDLFSEVTKGPGEETMQPIEPIEPIRPIRPIQPPFGQGALKSKETFKSEKEFAKEKEFIKDEKKTRNTSPNGKSSKTRKRKVKNTRTRTRIGRRRMTIKIGKTTRKN